MKAKLAYLTTPAPDVVVINIQPEGSDDLLRFEITKGHLARILVTGTDLAFREQLTHRVPETLTEDAPYERTASGA